GYKCCSNQNTKVQYVDNIGNWGVENGELCGIGYERCSFGILDDPYPCCSSVNPEVVMTDEKGNSWGYEDGQWCGIGEAKYDTSFRIKNRKTQECLITNLHSDTNVLLMGDCNHSKCLYAMNSQDPRMIECTEPDREINHHIHFKIVDNKYICLKNSVDPEICLNGNTKNNNSLKFETTKNEYSEWYIERWNPKWVDSIDEVIIKNPELKPEPRIIIKPKSTTTIVPTSTLEPISECYSKAVYPCCSPEITEVTYTDEEGNWGYENDDWCLITDSATTISTTTTTVEPTSTSINSEPSVTVKSGYVVYWFYHAFTNKCLYAPQEPNKPITVKPCDESNYSKWMVLTSRKGYFYSMAHPDYCLRVANVDTGSLELGKCDDQAKMVHDNDGFLTLIESSDKCVGFLNDNDMFNNEIEMNLNTCVKEDNEKFFNWDHNPTPITVCFSEAFGYPCCSDPNTSVATADEYGQWGIENNLWCGILGSETTVATLTPTINTETYYLYNTESNKCVHSSGILDSPITMAVCDQSSYTLWDIP
ncbi:Non-catalytic module family DOC2, partial [Piromyces sp. E2]